MGDSQKRLTFAVTPEVGASLKNIKKEFFSDRTWSAMIRELLLAGIQAYEKQEASDDEDHSMDEAPRNE